MFSLFRGTTPAVRNGTSRSIAALESMRLGGVVQWLTLRGHDVANPILLYVHGGPGGPDLGAMRHFVPELEEHFVVAHWSQRGAGKSYAHELSDDRMPDLVAAYVGVNQVVDRGAEELRAYRACLQRARERGDGKAVAQLEALGEPQDGAFASVDGTLLQRRWMRALGMVTFEPKLAAEIGRAIAMNPELTLRDLWNLFARVRWNMELLWPEFCRVDLAREIPAVDAPVFFVAGEHDWLTSPELARQYLDALRAPRKEFILFPRSGHVACFEEPRRFLEVMLRAKAECGPEVPPQIDRAAAQA
jgi:proline iminopeptidase